MGRQGGRGPVHRHGGHFTRGRGRITGRGEVTVETAQGQRVYRARRGIVIGVELAQVFARFGAQVAMVEAAPRLVPMHEPERDILGTDGPPADYRAVPRVTFTDPEIGSAGLTEAQVAWPRLEAALTGLPPG